MIHQMDYTTKPALFRVKINGIVCLEVTHHQKVSDHES